MKRNKISTNQKSGYSELNHTISKEYGVLFYRNKLLANLNLTGKNFNDPHFFLKMENGIPISPYKTCFSIFESWDNEQLQEVANGLSEIKPEERTAINKGVLR